MNGGGWGGTSFKSIDGRPNVEAVVGPDGHQHVDTYHQNQFTPAVIGYFNEIQNSTTLAVDAAKGADTATVTDPTGFIATRYIIIFNVSTVRFYLARILSIAGSVVTLDTPLDSAFPAGSPVDSAITNMNVNGSVTRRTFGLRGPGVIPGVSLTFDITRIIFTCYTTSAVTLALFGNLAKLTRGLVLRERNGETYNIFNVKSNGEIAGITLDWIPFTTTNPAQGQNGFVARLTFNGNEKLGVVKRISVGEDLELIIQDDLTGLTLFQAVAEGHIVEE